MLESSPPKVQQDMTPLVVQNLLKRVPNADCIVLDLVSDAATASAFLLCFPSSLFRCFCPPAAGHADVHAMLMQRSQAKGSRPESLLLTTMLAPPVAIRPSIPSIDGSNTSNEDDISMLMSSIVKFNADLQNAIDDGHNSEAIIQMWEHLQLKCAQVINGDLIGSSQQQKQQSKQLRGMNQRLKGKTGRFRGNLSGKRVDFSGRTVISPDPNLAIDQVAVPRHVCMILTYPERCTRHNRARLQTYIRNGQKVHPGANHIETTGLGDSDEPVKFNIMPHLREKLAENLQYGDVVERHLIDDDVVLFNRQPSLHKMSIMSHRCKVRPWRTFRFNESVCNPYNADFDGDEMNLHVPQTEEARAEATILMGTKANICTPRDGTPLIAAIQDFITGAFLLTQRDTFLTKSEASELAAYMVDAGIKMVLPPPAIHKPRQLWTGKQIVTLMLTTLPVYGDTLRINVEKKTKASYTDHKSLCPNDGYLVIYNSYHVCGSLDKSSIGAGGKDGLFYVLLKDYSADAAAEVMLRVAKLTCFHLQCRGFSLGIEDVYPSPRFNREKAGLLQTGYSECDDLEKQLKEGKLEASPGDSAESTLEAMMTGVLSDIRTQAGRMCLKELTRFCAPLVMARCGSKGGNENMAQMIACVGQQTIGGKRIPSGFEDRALPHFAKHDAAPAAKGFVSNSFFSGLTPSEFFFHTMCGREGLVDTAVKTAETGYLSRRLMKAMEDLGTDYDLSVHNSSGTMIQFRYGDDGLDPAGMEGDGTADGLNAPVNLMHLYDMVHRDPAGRKAPALFPYQILRHAETVFASDVFKELRVMQKSSSLAHSLDGISEVEHFYIGQVRTFLQNKCKAMADARKEHGLPSLLHGPADMDGEGPFETPSSTPTTAKYADESPTVELDIDPAELKVLNICLGYASHFSKLQLDLFMETSARKYARASIEPGAAVGAIGAQSLGEPSTQMTLKTFHFAGIASMNITQGVPRIKEIINASKSISSPVIIAPLYDSKSQKAALAAKAQADKCLLGDLLVYIDEVYEANEAYLVVRMNMKRVKRLRLEVTMITVAEALLAVSAFKLKESSLEILSVNKLKIKPSTAKSSLFFAMQTLRKKLPDVMVRGSKGIERCIVTKGLGAGKDIRGKRRCQEDDHCLMVEGTDILAAMGIRGVQAHRVASNHIVEVEKALGIEAARATIMNEMQTTMNHHGMTLDTRHVMLLADLMTYKGEVLGCTRFGLEKMKDSVMMLASFEKTADHLFEAALHGTKDPITGVSECIITGVPMNLGTGLFKMVHDPKRKVGKPYPQKNEKPTRRKPVFDDPELHRKFVLTPL